ncbi:MAG: ABC transporter permease [Clostridia bacterium]|nr:ABC transporter permease [Clostridia bacterium]
MKHLFTDLWASIRKSPFLFLFLFIQIVITSLVLYIVLANYYWIEEESNVAQIAWGDKEYIKFLPRTNAPQKKRSALTLSTPYFLASTDEELQENLKIFEQTEKFYNEVSKIEGLTIIENQDNWELPLIEPKEWEEIDKKMSEHGMFAQDSINYEMLRPRFVGSEYLNYFKVKLSEGTYFEPEDYLYDKEYVPVLMGNSFKKYYSIGEEFTAEVGPSAVKTLRVIGFIAPNQYYTPVDRASFISSYDNIVLLPYIERPLSDLFGDYSSYVFLFSTRLLFSFYIIEPDQYESAMEQIEELLASPELKELSELIRPFKLRIEKELASNYQDQLAISIVVCITTLLFSLFSFVFTMLYKIDGNMKNYAIRMVVGETRTGIAMRYLFESFVVFFLGQFTGFFLFKIYAVNSYIYQGYDYLEAPTLKTGILLNIAFYIVTAIILYICISIKLRSYSIATLIRGTEVKKDKRLPFYRVVIFCMLAIVGVFSMFIASYQVALDRIDLYYTGYYTENVKIAYVSQLAEEDAPNVKVAVDEIGSEVPDAIINRYISASYRGDDYIEERGIYFNGYIDPVNMLQGRFFTHEEVADRKYNIAVVGKEIYEKYVTFNENNEPIYHSPDLDKDLLVIGVMGKEDLTTNLDLIVLMPIRLGAIKFGAAGTYTLDGKDEATVAKLEEVFTRHVSETAMVNTREYTPRLTVEAPTDLLFMLLIMIIINAVVFCFYYVSKQENIHYVKKLVGYSKWMILFDTFLDFSILTLGAFVTGNAIVIILKDTIFKDVQLFSIYMIDFKVVIISLVAILLLTIFLSVVAISKTFTAGNNNRHRN